LPGKATISGGSLAAMSNPVFSTGARSGGSRNGGLARDLPSAIISGVVSTGSFAWPAASTKFWPSSIPFWIRL
jgi:hypothetical protein